jgi:hypothetical protein
MYLGLNRYKYSYKGVLSGLGTKRNKENSGSGVLSLGSKLYTMSSLHNVAKGDRDEAEDTPEAQMLAASDLLMGAAS